MPSSPAGVLRALEWCYDHRALSAYGELLAEDFRFYCSALDSAGQDPWTRQDELLFAAHLFVGGKPGQPPARTIQLQLDKNLFVFPDPTHAQSDPLGRWHRSIRTHALLSIQTADWNVVEVLGAVRFYLVRGDSAAIPQDLRQRGFGPDSARWYIRRWEDETAAADGRAFPAARASASVAAAPPVLETQPARQTSWCRLKALYR